MSIVDHNGTRLAVGDRLRRKRYSSTHPRAPFPKHPDRVLSTGMLLGGRRLLVRLHRGRWAVQCTSCRRVFVDPNVSATLKRGLSGGGVCWGCYVTTRRANARGRRGRRARGPPSRL
jgi:hypothetical protein